MSLAQPEPAVFPALATYEAIFRLAPSALALASPGGRVVLANDAFRTLFGAGEVAGRRVDQVFRGAAAEQMTHAIELCLADGETARLRIAHAAAGEVVRLQVEVRRLEIGREAYVVIGAAARDLALSLSELGETGVLAELGSLSRGMVYIHDTPRGRLRYSRHPLVARLALPEGPLGLDHVRSLLHPDDRERFEAHARAQGAAADREVLKDTFRMRGADGAWLWINIRSRVFARDAAGAVQRIIGVATDVTDVQTHAASMAEAAKALALAELKERRRIGRELHDSTAQLLVAARLGLASLEREAKLTGGPLRLLDDARRAVADAQHEIRNFSYMLHPPSLQEEGLETTLRTFAAGFARRTGLAISVRVAPGLVKLPFPLEVALFRVTQEALMNVYRHAHARKVAVRLHRHGAQVVLEVEDDGVGLPGAGGKLDGVGVNGMQARMIQLGGGFELLPGKVGLKVRATARAEVAEL